MPKSSSRPPERTPRVPPPSAAYAADGMEGARELARRYLPDAVRFLAGIALAPDSEAPLHSRMLAAKELVAIAGAIPQATPSLPAPQPLYEPADGARAPD
jgi:hypothetical protein